MPRVSAARLHFRHAVDGEFRQRFRLDDLFHVGASEALIAQNGAFHRSLAHWIF